MSSKVDTIPDSDYYQLNRLARLRYRLRTDPRRVGDLAVLFASMFVDWCGSTILAPITPWYTEKLAPEWDQGTAASVLLASYACGTLISCLIAGPLSDWIGRRPVFLGAMTVHTASYFLLANAWNMTSFVAFRVMGGISSGTRPVMMAFLTDSSRREDMPFYGVMMSLCVCLGMSIAPALGGVLAEINLSAPFYAVGIAAAVVLVLMAIFLREPSHDDAKDAANAAANDTAPYNRWFYPTLSMLMLAAFCGQYIYSSFTTVLGLLGVDRYGLSASENGLVLGSQAFVIVIINLIYLPLTDRIPHAIVGSFGLYLPVLLIIIPYVYNLTATIFLGMSVTIGCTLYFAGMAYLNSVVAPAHRRGLVNSIVMSLANTGGIFGPLIGGSLFDMDPENRAYPFFVTTGLALVGGTACLVMHRGIAYTLELLDKTEALQQ